MTMPNNPEKTMKVKGRPEKIEFAIFNTEEDNAYKSGWNAALDANTEYFVSVLEGLRYKGENDINDVHTECACKFNARIDGALRELQAHRGEG